MVTSPASRRRRLLGLTAVGLLLAGCSTSPTKSGVNGEVADHSGLGQPSTVLAANLESVACGAGQLCAAGGKPFVVGQGDTALLLSHSAGLRWNTARSTVPAGSPIASVACAQQACLAVAQTGFGPVLLRVSSRSAQWRWTQVGQPSAGALAVVACSGEQRCIGVASGQDAPVAVGSKDGGLSWSTLGALPEGMATASRASCATTSTCAVVGTGTAGPMVALTSDGGRSWQAAQISKKATAVISASCRADRSCVVVARKGADSKPLLLGARHMDDPFTKVVAPGAVATPNDVSCAQSACLLVGASPDGRGAAALLSAGGSSRTISLRYVPSPLRAASCSSATSCAAVSTASVVTLRP